MKRVALIVAPRVGTDIRYTEGEGFTCNDGMVQKYLTEKGEEESVDTCEEAIALVEAEYGPLTSEIEMVKELKDVPPAPVAPAPPAE